MPIPSLRQKIYDEAYDEAYEAGLEKALEQAATTLLRDRFGTDDRIPAIAHRLASLGPDSLVDITRATSLDELAAEG